MISAILLALTATVQDGAGVFPPRAVLPSLVGSGGTPVATPRLGTLLLNPANAAVVKGIEVGMASYPQTGLEGFGGAFSTGRRIRIGGAVWSFAVKDIFDDDLVDVDPSLAALSAAHIGAALGLAYGFGPLAIGALATHRMHSIVGVQADGSSLSIGARLESGRLELSTSVIDVPIGSFDRDVSPPQAWLVGLAGSVNVASRAVGRLETDMRVVGGDAPFTDFGLLARLQLPLVEVTTGCARVTGCSAGGAVTINTKWRFDIAASVASRNQLDQRIALSVTFQ